MTGTKRGPFPVTLKFRTLRSWDYKTADVYRDTAMGIDMLLDAARILLFYGIDTDVSIQHDKGKVAVLFESVGLKKPIHFHALDSDGNFARAAKALNKKVWAFARTIKNGVHKEKKPSSRKKSS